MMGAPLWGDTGGRIDTTPTHLRNIFPRIPHKPNNHLCAIQPNTTNHPRVIHPNETVGAAPVCPPERPRSGVSIPKIHASCAGDGRWMRPCRATRAGTQAPPLPISIIFFHASYTSKITIYAQFAQTKPTAPTNLHQTTWCAITPSGLYFRKRRVGKCNAAYPGL